MTTREESSRRLDVVEREVRIAARPEIVFGFFTDPATMIRWKGTDAPWMLGRVAPIVST